MKRIDLDLLRKFITEKYGPECGFSTGIMNDFTTTIPTSHLTEIVSVLMEDFDVFHLSAITAQIRTENEDKIELLYHFWQGVGFTLMTAVPTSEPKIDTLMALIPGADFYEREVAEMFGVEFTGREETPHLLLSDKWKQGPPFRQTIESEQ
ncbi:NADH-quinone oxidoreductase subunit C [bacterium]|nr:NADH-quinone oxidoreductase subunit C [bacterium]